MLPAILLALAILTEVAGTVALRYAEGFTKLVPSVVVFVGYGGSLYLLSLVLRSLELGFVYAVWAGAGTALVAAIGILALGEPATVLKLVSILLIILGVVGLNLSSGS